MKTLSVIIPVFNEEATVRNIISKVKKTKIPRIKKEIIVVDDASTDLSIEILASIPDITILKNKRNLGKGASIRKAITKASGDIIIIQDADLEYDPKYYSKLLEPILRGRARVVYGSRLKHFPLHISGKMRTPLLTHYLGNKLLTFITNLLYGSKLTDMETCYKVFDAKTIKGLSLVSNRFEIEPEITAKLLKAGYKILEVPIKVSPRGYDEGKKITWKDGFGAAMTLLKFKFSK